MNRGAERLFVRLRDLHGAMGIPGDLTPSAPDVQGDPP